MFDLLSDGLFTVDIGQETQKNSLPQVLEALGQDKEILFSRVQAHQKHSLFALFVQLAALALDEAEEEEIYHPAKDWEAMLLKLTDGAREPWSLIVEDKTRSAFLQPPALQPYKAHFETPQDLDILVVPKNHELKSARFQSAGAEDWLLALLTLQTSGGFSGRGNYGVMRMNGGLGSRPYVALVPKLSWNTRWQKDTHALLNRRQDEGWAEEEKLKLLWLKPWSGADSLSIEVVDTDAIEIGRLRRLYLEPSGAIFAMGCPTTAARIASKDLRGVVGDPWTPTLEGKDGKSLTLSASGFNYKLISKLLFRDGYAPSLAQEPVSDEKISYLWLEGITRGQGKTEGFHQRIIELSSKLKRRLRGADERLKLAARTRDWIKDAETARLKVLKPAILTTLQAAELNKLNRKDNRAESWLSILDNLVDQRFFPLLFETLDAPQSRRSWQETLKTLMSEVFEQAQVQVPLPSSRKYRALATGERIFNALLYKNFPELKEAKTA